MNRNYRLLYLMLLCVGLGFLTEVQASHNMGVDISYQCINQCTIRVHWRGYRDCTGIPLGTPNITFTGQGAGCNQPIALGAWSTVVRTEVTPICAGMATRCTTPGSTINGVQEYYNWRDYNICSLTCSTYVMSWSDCCRNGTITSGASNNAIYVGSTILNPFVTPCNSTPQFTVPPVPYICNGQTFTFNQGAIDPDGDSLSYSLGPCYRSNGQLIGYNAGFSPNAPLGPAWIVTINPVSGDITMTPNPGSIQVGVMCVYVQEWRNGVMIGQVVRDMQITVLNCPNNNIPTVSPAQNVSGGSVNAAGTFITTCVGSPISFQILAADTNQTQNVRLFWNQALAGGAFVNCTNPLQMDTVFGQVNLCGTFTWTPTTNGTFFVTFTARDNNCPITGQGQRTIQIYVGALGVTQSVVIPGCGPVELCATTNSGIPPFTFNWQGAGGLSANPNVNDSCLFHQYPPGLGVYPYTLTVTDSNGCSNVINDSIVISAFTEADAGLDVIRCAGDSAVLGAPSSPNEVYQWYPPTGLSSATVSNPTAILYPSGNFSQVFQYRLYVLDTSTGCDDWDTMQIRVDPIPIAAFGLPGTACEGSIAQLTYTGPSALGQMNWNFGPGATPTTSNTLGPHIVSWSTPGWNYVTLRVIQNGCTSNVALDSIFIFPIPIAAIVPVQDQCINTNTFNFTNGGTFGSTATFNWVFGPDAFPATSTAQNPANIIFSSAGQKSAALTITENGCVSAQATVIFQVHRMPDASWYYQGSPQCLDVNSYCLVANGSGNTAGAAYSWSIPNGVPPTSSLPTACGISFSQSGPQPVTLSVVDNGCLSVVLGNVDVLPNPVVDAGPPVSFCDGEGGVMVHGSVIQTTVAPYYWSWWCDSTNTWCGLDSTNDDDPIANPTVTTSYYVRIVDFNGCRSNVDSTIVTVRPKPIVNAGPDLFICTMPSPGDQINATIQGSAPGPFTYQWSPAAGLNSANIEDPYARPVFTTIYHLVVTSSNGCVSNMSTLDTLSTVTVNVVPQPIANAGPDQDLCLHSSMVINGQGMGGNGNYTYQWSPSTGMSSANVASPTVSPALTTDYILVVYSFGCPSIGDTMTVFVHTLPTVDAGPDRDICLGESTLLNGNAWGDPTSPNYTFNWTPNQAITNNTLEDPTVNPVSTTTYTVVATSIWGCESNPDVAIVNLRPSPQAEAGPNVTLCYETPYTLQGSYYFTTTPSAPANLIFTTWSPAANLSNPIILNPVATLTQTEVYTLIVNYQNCADTDQVIITVMPDLGAEAIADTGVICGGDSVMLSATGGQGGASFTWLGAGVANPNSSSTMASPNSTTNYQVVLSEGGCNDTALVDLDVIPGPVSAFVNSTPVGCEDHEVSFLETTTNAFNWIWDFGDGSPISNTQNPTHIYPAPGTYFVNLTAIGPGDCKHNAPPTQITIYEKPVAAFTSNPPFPANLSFPNTEVTFTNTSAGASQMVWDFGDGGTSDQSSPVHFFENEGQFMVKLFITNEGGCIDEIVQGPYIIASPELSIPNIFSPNADGSNDRFIVIYSGSQPFKMSLSDRWGNKVFSTTNKMQGWDGNIASGEAPEGVYYYTIEIGNRSFAGNVTLLR